MNTSSDSTASSASVDKRPLLVPVDFSTCSINALLFAGQLAACLQAPLLVLHVLHDRNGKPGFYKKGREQVSLKPIDDIAADMLEEFIEDVRRHAGDSKMFDTLSTMLVNGLPASRISEIAVREDAALIVMGTHGRSALSRLASGSVAAHVVMHSPVPVTVVKAPPAGRQDAEWISTRQWWERQAESDSHDLDSHRGMAV